MADRMGLADDGVPDQSADWAMAAVDQIDDALADDWFSYAPNGKPCLTWTGRQAIGSLIEGAIPEGSRVVSPGHVLIPQSAQEAKAMWLTGERWVRDHAPELIRANTDPSLERVEAMREDGNAELAIDVLSRGLLSIAERPSWDSVAGRDRKPGLALKPFYDGFDIAAKTRADRAREALDRASLVRQMTDAIAERYRALPVPNEGAER